jgi:hypothetical protein
VSISNPKNVNKVVGPTVLLSARGTPSSWQMFLKTSINNALLIVNPTDFDLLGIQFEGKYWVDKNLPMGCSISCSLFEKFATFLHCVDSAPFPKEDIISKTPSKEEYLTLQYSSAM